MLAFKAVLSIIPCILLGISSVCLIFVGIGCTASSSPRSNLYFLQANTTGVYSELEKVFDRRRGLTDPVSSALNTASDDADNASDSSQALNEASSIVSSANNAIQTAESTVSSAMSNIEDIKSQIPGFYRIGLWGYCQGSSDSNQVKNCTSPSLSNWFNLTDALGLDETIMNKILPAEVQSLERIYHQASRFMSAAYVLAFIFTPASLFLGLFRSKANQLSILKGLVISIAIVSNLVASVMATAIYCCLAKALSSTSFIDGSIGSSMFGNTWAAFVLTVGAGTIQLGLKMFIYF